MIQVYVSSVIPAPAGAVWPLLRDFNGLPRWHPLIAESRIEQQQAADRVGCVRQFRLHDGGVIREQLLGLSDFDCRVTYSILQSPMGVSQYVATLSLTPGLANSCVTASGREGAVAGSNHGKRLSTKRLLSWTGIGFGPLASPRPTQSMNSSSAEVPSI